VKARASGTDGEQLDALVERVEQWRSGRQGRERIPEHLWDAAAQVARLRGVTPTARALQFSHALLKQRVARAGNVSIEQKPAFVEVQMPAVSVSGVGVPSANSRVAIEVTGGRGGRMRVEFADARAVDVVGLVNAFWSRES
jgi:hypothetical protein